MLLSMPRRSRRLSRRTVLTAGGDFEDGVSDFTAGASTSRAQTTAEHATGATALAVAATAAAGIAQVFTGLAPNIGGATQGRRYRLTARIKAGAGTAGDTYRLILRENGGGQAQASVDSTDYVVPADWALITCEGVLAQDDRDNLRVDHFALATPADGDTYYLDDVRIVRVA